MTVAHDRLISPHDCRISTHDCRFSMHECRFSMHECRFSMHECRFSTYNCRISYILCTRTDSQPSKTDSHASKTDSHATYGKPCTTAKSRHQHTQSSNAPQCLPHYRKRLSNANYRITIAALRTSCRTVIRSAAPPREPSPRLRAAGTARGMADRRASRFPCARGTVLR